MSLHFTSKSNVLVAIKKARREDDLKLITDLKRNVLELYDLSADLSEQNNLVEDAAYADELEKIAARFAEIYPTPLLR